VEAEGGSIDCNSILGSSTTFVVTLPFAAIPPDRADEWEGAGQTEEEAASASVLA
jgi:hypothetical protein